MASALYTLLFILSLPLLTPGKLSYSFFLHSLLAPLTLHSPSPQRRTPETITALAPEANPLSSVW